MADYYHQVIFDTDIPATAMTPLERLFLEAIFQSEPSEGGIFFYAENSPNSFIEVGAKELTAALDASAPLAPTSKAVTLGREALENVMDGEETIAPEDVSDIMIETEGEVWEEILQDICKRDPSIKDIVAHHAFTCSKMRSDGFGGAVTRVTAEKIETISTYDMLDSMRKADKKAA